MKVTRRQTSIFLSARNTHVCLTFSLVLQSVCLFPIFTIDWKQLCGIKPTINNFFFYITNKITKTSSNKSFLQTDEWKDSFASYIGVDQSILCDIYVLDVFVDCIEYIYIRLGVIGCAMSKGIRVISDKRNSSTDLTKN